MINKNQAKSSSCHLQCKHLARSDGEEELVSGSFLPNQVAGEMVCWNTSGNKLVIVANNSNDREDESHDVVVFDM